MWDPSRPPGGGHGRQVNQPPARSRLRVSFGKSVMPKKIGVGTYSETLQGGDYSDEEWDFIKAMAAYQKRWRRRYPSYREVLFVLKCLGYRKVAAPVAGEEPTAGEVELVKAAQPQSTPPPAPPRSGEGSDLPLPSQGRGPGG